jgi:hypothetical protein
VTSRYPCLLHTNQTAGHEHHTRPQTAIGCSTRAHQQTLSVHRWHAQGPLRHHSAKLLYSHRCILNFELDRLLAASAADPRRITPIQCAPPKPMHVAWLSDPARNSDHKNYPSGQDANFTNNASQAHRVPRLIRVHTRWCEACCALPNTRHAGCLLPVDLGFLPESMAYAQHG